MVLLVSTKDLPSPLSESLSTELASSVFMTPSRYGTDRILFQMRIKNLGDDFRRSQKIKHAFLFLCWFRCWNFCWNYRVPYRYCQTSNDDAVWRGKHHHTVIINWLKFQGSARLYSGSIDCASKIMKNEGGIPSFFKGCFSNILRGLGGAIVLVMYDEMKKHVWRSCKT